MSGSSSCSINLQREHPTHLHKGHVTRLVQAVLHSTSRSDSPVHGLFDSLVSSICNGLFSENVNKRLIASFAITSKIIFLVQRKSKCGHSRSVSLKAHLQQALQCCLFRHFDLKHIGQQERIYLVYLDTQYYLCLETGSIAGR